MTLARAIAALLLALASLTGWAPQSRAQTGRVDGVVYDSLRMQPLAGAIVQLVQPPPSRDAYSATTDSLGRFSISGIRAGKYISGFLHPLLDTLGVLAAYGSLTIADDDNAHLSLSIPSAAKLTSAICGPAKAASAKGADSIGTVVGHATDAMTGAPVPSALISVSWPVLAVDARGVHRETRQLHAKANDEGWFALCGLDAGEFQLRAESGARNSGYVDLTVPPRELTRVSLELAPDSSSGGKLAGTVTTKDGRPLEGAQVVVDGSTTTASTDTRGSFSLAALPLGTRMIESRALGYAPTRIAITPSRDETQTITIVMDKRVETLQEVTVYGKRSSRMRDLTGFLDRSKRGFGHFVTRAEIDATNPQSVCDLLRRMPGVNVATDAGIGCSASIRGMQSLRSCEPTVYLDNMPFMGTMSEFTAMVLPRQIMGIEQYSSATEPIQFPGGCGAIVVWTR